MALSPDRQRERLKGLMVVRVVIVTAFLGSAMAVNLTALAEFSNPRNFTLVGLIVGTYLLTIGHALAMRRELPTAGLAYAQLAGDLIVATILVLVTGGFDSLFLFFFHLTIINAAIVTDQRGAIITAGITAACMVYFATITMGWLPHPIIDDGHLPPAGPIGLLYEVTIHSLAGVLIAVLAGHLAERLNQATEELERQKTDIQDLRALNQNILSSLSSGLLTIDPSGHIIFFNRAAEEITGLQAHHVLGHPLKELFPDLASTALHPADASLDARLESTFERPDGKLLFLGFSTSILRDGNHQEAGRIIIFQDLSDIRTLEAQMKRSERLAAIGELSAAIAHEIRNPLASISGSVEMLSQDDHTSDDNRLLMDIIVREVDRLDTLIHDFLAYSQPRQLQTGRKDLLPIIRDVEQLFRANAHRAAITVDLHLDLETPAIAEIDPEAFRQVVWNLLQNASDALADLPKDRRTLRLELFIPPDAPTFLCFAVEDDGPGVAADARERIFEPFFTTKDSGTGLGLATTFRLIEELNGRVTLVPPHHLRGARFEITLPRAEPSLPAQPTGATPTVELA